MIKVVSFFSFLAPAFQHPPVYSLLLRHFGTTFFTGHFYGHSNRGPSRGRLHESCLAIQRGAKPALCFSSWHWQKLNTNGTASLCCRVLQRTQHDYLVQWGEAKISWFLGGADCYEERKVLGLRPLVLNWLDHHSCGLGREGEEGEASHPPPPPPTAKRTPGPKRGWGEGDTPDVQQALR
jgi:hypothetical protein